MASSGSTDTDSFLLRGILNSYFIEDKDDAYYDILWRFVIWDEDLERYTTIDWYHHAYGDGCKPHQTRNWEGGLALQIRAEGSS